MFVKIPCVKGWTTGQNLTSKHFVLVNLLLHKVSPFIYVLESVTRKWRNEKKKGIQ